METDITHHGIYSTTWGGYVLFSAETPAALAEYQKFHYQNYAHGFRIIFEPVTNITWAQPSPNNPPGPWSSLQGHPTNCVFH